MTKHWKIEIILHDDCNPEPVTSSELEKIVDSMNLPAGIIVVDVKLSVSDE